MSDAGAPSELWVAVGGGKSAGDAYCLRGELDVAEHPVTGLARHNAVDEAGRVASLDAVRRILREHGGEVRVFGYHDGGELPAGCL